MNKKKVLIVSRSFYPINSPRSFRATELARELANQGHEVTVITPADPSHEEYAKLNNVTFKDLRVPHPEDTTDVKKVKLNFLEKLSHRLKQQFLLKPDFALKDIVYEALLAEEKVYDILISIAAPHPVHWGVSKALKENKRIANCWIADCGDPFMLSHNLQYKRPFYFKYYEADFCKRADFITIPASSAKEGYYKEFHDKLRVIPQGFRFEDVKISNNPKSNNLIEFGYAGSLIKDRRDPTELLQYLKERNVDFRFVIYSKNKAFAETLVKSFPGNVIYKGEADRLDVLYHLSELDFVLNFENVGTNQTPSKLIDYAIINKPILSVMFGELNSAAVDEFVSGNYKSQVSILDVDQYRIENIAKRFVDLCN